jgi:hypothetical protein
MADISRLIDTLDVYAGLIDKMPKKVEKAEYPDKLETKLKVMVTFQRGYGITSRSDEVIERLRATSEESETRGNLIERITYLTNKSNSIIDSLNDQALSILAYFMPQESEPIYYLSELIESRPSEKLQTLKEEESFFEVLEKMNEMLSTAYLRSVLALGCHPQEDISREVMKKID